MVGDIISNDPEALTTYMETGQNLIWKFALLQYEYQLSRSQLFFTGTLGTRHRRKPCTIG